MMLKARAALYLYSGFVKHCKTLVNTTIPSPFSKMGEGGSEMPERFIYFASEKRLAA